MSYQKPIEATVVFLPKTDLATGKPAVLLGRKSLQASFGAGKLVPPGGKCDPGESYEACVVRECREETGIEIDVSSLCLVADFFSFRDGKSFFHVVVYIATIYRGEPIVTSEMSPEWHLINALPFEQMLEGDDKWVPRVLRGERLTVHQYKYGDDPCAILVYPL